MTQTWEGVPASHTGPLALLAFVAELAMLVGLGLAGWGLGGPAVTSALLAVALPCAAAALWGRWCAPRSSRRLPRLERWALKVTLFATTFFLLMASDPQPFAGFFGLGMWLVFVGSLPADRRP